MIQLADPFIPEESAAGSLAGMTATRQTGEARLGQTTVALTNKHACLFSFTNY
jgi:hypothetical protein